MIYVTEQYRLDTDRRELSRDGVTVPLRPKVFALLALLIEERERVLERETLFERLWPGRFVSDATLSSCVKELRKALGDTGKERRFVKTVHGQGFRFVATVATEAPREQRQETPLVDAVLGEEERLEESVEADGDDCRPTATSVDAGRAERKRLSALRWAVLDADAVAARLDPERMHALMQRLLARVHETVERYDGQITQWLSDGCLALFGVPRSHDDDARRAVLAAEDIQGDCRSLCERHGLSIACGVTSSVVIVGGLSGRPDQHYSASGALLRAAETLCFAAGDGEIAIDDDTYRLVRGDVRVQPFRSFETGPGSATSQDTGKPAVRGPWLLRQIVGAGAGVPRRFRRTLAPLIGRSREMELLAHRLDEARGGAGQAVTLVGAAGIGKTRLLEEFRASLDEEGIASTLVRCQPQRRHTIDHLLVECLHALCGTSATDRDDVVAERVHAVARAAGIDDEASRTLLLGLLGRNADDVTSVPLSVRARREIAESALQRLVFVGDDVRVLLVEDLHWIDASSAAWLGTLVQRMGVQRLLLIATYRIGTRPEWLRCAGVTQIPLAPLAPPDAARLVEALPGPVRDEGMTTRIVASAGGNPFLLSEITLRRDDEQPIPDTVQAVLAARIDALDAADKRVLQTASVLGLSTRAELLVGVCEGAAEEVRESLLRLQALEFLGVEFDAGDERVVFRHALVQEAAYTMLMAEERKGSHGRVVAQIDRVFVDAGAAQPEVLALHCEQAGFVERAARLWQRAAWNASVRCAYVETARHVERGLELLDANPSVGGAPPSGAPVALDGSSGARPVERVELELALMRSLGHAQMATHGYASRAVAVTWSRAEALCRELADDVSLFRVSIGLADYHLVSGELDRALPIVRRLLRIARRENSVVMRVRAKAAMGELMMYFGRMRSAVRHLESCLGLVERTERSSFLASSAVVLAEGQLSWTLWALGEERSALAHAERALAAAHASGKPFLQAMALTMNAELHCFRDDAARAAVFAREAVDVAERQRFVHWHGFALVALGWSEARRGDTVAGLVNVERGIALSTETGERLLMPLKLGVLADVQRLHGRPVQARETLGRAFELAELTNGRYCLSGLSRVRRALDGTESEARHRDGSGAGARRETSEPDDDGGSRTRSGTGSGTPTRVARHDA